MKIFIIGATGMAGQALTEKAVAAGYEVTANARNAEKLAALQTKLPTISVLAKDAFALTATDFADADVILDAFATAPDQAYLHVDLATKLIALLRNTDTRIGFVLGAGSLWTGVGADKHLAYEDILADPETVAWRAIPANQLDELEFLRRVKNVNWFGVSPGSLFIPGAEATDVLLGQDELLVNAAGESVTTPGTLATAMMNEIANPMHNQERFTVVNG